MAEQPIIFDYQEIVTAMIRERGLTEGIWQLFVEFSIVAANMAFNDTDTPNPPKGPEDGPPEFILPTAIIPIKRIGLVRVKQLTPLAVDATKVRARRTSRKR